MPWGSSADSPSSRCSEHLPLHSSGGPRVAGRTWRSPPSLGNTTVAMEPRSPPPSRPALPRPAARGRTVTFGEAL
eukprot:11669502-Alexandrium_andersonii.AAC.1